MGTVSTIDDLLGQAFGVEEVPLPGGGSVKVRPLSRAEALAVKGVELDVLEMEQRLLSAAMVEPKMTAEQVGKWQEVSAAGQIEPVCTAILRLSGMAPDSGRAAYADFRDEPGP